MNIINNSLKSLAIFGENGAGKTTLLKTIETFINYVINYQIDHRNYISFKNTLLEFTFIFDSEEIQISLTFNYDNVEKKVKVQENVYINNKKIMYSKELEGISENISMIRFAHLNNLIQEKEKDVVNNLFNFLSNSIYYKCDEKEIKHFGNKYDFNLTNIIRDNHFLVIMYILKKLTKY